MYRLRDFSVDNAFAQVDFPKMRRGGVDASFFAAYIPPRLVGDAATEYARALLSETERQVALCSDSVAFARCAGGVRRNRAAGLLSVILAIENGSAIQESFDLLREFKKRGVRYITLTHSADNQIADSCSGKGTWGGLSPFGRTLIPEMNRVGMMIDLAHSADSTIRDVLSLSGAPVAYTHGCCRALASHRRNLSDELLRGIADNGGVACMSIYPCFLSDEFCRVLGESGLEQKSYVEDEFIADPANPAKRAAWEAVQRELMALPRPSASLVADHIEHAVSVAGIDHVGLGTDYDGIEVAPVGLETIEGFPLIFEELRRRSFSQKDISKIAGGNLLRVLKEVRKFSAQANRRR